MEGTYIYLWLIHVDVWHNQSNVVKQLSSNLKIYKLKNFNEIFK